MPAGRAEASLASAHSLLQPGAVGSRTGICPSPQEVGVKEFKEREQKNDKKGGGSKWRKGAWWEWEEVLRKFPLGTSEDFKGTPGAKC